LNAVDQDTSSKQEVATVLIYSCLKAVTLAANTFSRHFRVSTLSRPKVAGPDALKALITGFKFQHTAARRRLTVLQTAIRERRCFNTQPPEGGWASIVCKLIALLQFQHTAA